MKRNRRNLTTESGARLRESWKDRLSPRRLHPRRSAGRAATTPPAAWPMPLCCGVVVLFLLFGAGQAGGDALRSSACPQVPAAIRGASSSLLLLEDPVKKGREALGSGWQYPWYDAKNDDVRRVDVRETWDWQDGNWNLGGFRLNWIQFLFWGVIALVLGLLAYFLIRAYLRREDRRALEEGGDGGVRSVDDAERIAALPFQVDKRGPHLLEQARRHYQAGQYSQAIVYLFSHQLVELDKRQFIRLAKGKTNRQYLREVAPAGAIRDLLHQTMVAFEDVFFGNHALDRAKFENCWNRLDEFDRLTAQVS